MGNRENWLMKIKVVKKQKVRTVGVKFKSKVNGGREEILLNFLLIIKEMHIF